MLSPGMKRRLAFDVISEGWNTYTCPGDLVFKIRPLLMRAWTTAEPGTKGNCDIFLDQHQLMVALPMETPIETNIVDPTSFSEAEGMAKESVEILSRDEVWNVYQLPELGLRLKAQYSVNSLMKVIGGIDMHGEQMYIMEGETIIKPADEPAPPPSNSKA